MNEVVSISSLSKTYVIKPGWFSKDKPIVVNALKNINFKIYEGETIGLIGLNGAGKSTLIKIMLGILTQNSGKVSVFDRDPFKNRIKNLFDIGVIFGQKTQLRWDLSPLDSYHLNRELYSIDKEVFSKNLEKYSEILDIHSFINRPVRTLSLGQKMRAEFLSSLLHSPKLLILDEPTIGIDIVSKKNIINLIKELKKEMTIIYTSHNLNEVYEISDRIIVLDKGKVVVDKSKQDIINNVEYLSLKVYLKKALESIELDNNEIEINKLNNYEYIFKFVKKDLLKQFLDHLYTISDIDYFEVSENNLEKMLKDVTNVNIN